MIHNLIEWFNNLEPLTIGVFIISAIGLVLSISAMVLSHISEKETRQHTKRFHELTNHKYDGSKIKCRVIFNGNIYEHFLTKTEILDFVAHGYLIEIL